MKALGVGRRVSGGKSTPEALHVFQGEGDLAQAKIPLSQAVAIRAARDEQPVFRCQAGEKNDILGTVRRVKNFDPLKAGVDETGKAVQCAMIRVGQDGDPRCIPDGRDGLGGVESRPLHIGGPTLGKESIEGLLHVADCTSRDERPSHMESADGSRACNLADRRLGKRDSESVEAAQDFDEPIPAPRREKIERTLKGCILPLDEVAEDMHLLARLMDGEFNTWDDLHGQLAPCVEGLGDSCNRVVVGEGNGVYMVARRVSNDLPRREGSVRIPRVQVKVSSPCHPCSLSPSSMMGQSRAVLTIRSAAAVGQGQGSRGIRGVAFRVQSENGDAVQGMS